MAAVQGAQQVGGALFASTLTTVCVLLPIDFAQGLTIAYNLIASLVVALTLVPTLASTMLKKNINKRPGWFERFTKSYGKLLFYSLKYKPVVLILEIDEVSSVGAMTGNSSGMMRFSQGNLSFYIRLQEDRSNC